MAKKQKQNDDVKVVSPAGYAEYAYVHSPDTEGQYADGKYKLTVRWPKGTDLSALEDGINEAAQKKWPNKLPRNLMLPIRDGDEYYEEAETDEQRERRERFRGHLFVTAKTRFKPGVVDSDGVPLAAEEGECVDCRVDPIYSGDLVRFSGFAHPYINGSNKGVTIRLKAVKRIEKGERTVGNPNDDFDDDDDVPVSGGEADPDDI